MRHMIRLSHLKPLVIALYKNNERAFVVSVNNTCWALNALGAPQLI